MNSPEEIIAEVAVITGVPAPAITGPRRTTRITWARFLAVAAIHQTHSWWSLRDLANQVNRTDHATASHALQRFHALVNSNHEFRQLATELKLV